MQRFLLSACLSAALATSLAGLSPAQVQVGDPAPGFAGEFLNSDAKSLDDLRGRVVFVDFWRTW